VDLVVMDDSGRGRADGRSGASADGLRYQPVGCPSARGERRRAAGNLPERGHRRASV